MHDDAWTVYSDAWTTAPATGGPREMRVRGSCLPYSVVKLRDQFGGSLTYARRLLERAVRIVLASGAHGGVKSLYERALAHWPPTAADDGALASSSASPVRFARGDTPRC